MSSKGEGAKYHRRRTEELIVDTCSSLSHKIRREAHLAAWEGRDQSAFNPFARRGNTGSYSDVESVQFFTDSGVENATILPITQQILDAEKHLISEHAKKSTIGGDISTNEPQHVPEHSSSTPLAPKQKINDKVEAIVEEDLAAAIDDNDEMGLFIATVTGQPCYVHATRALHVSELKNRIQDQIGIPPVLQRLIFNRKQLEDDKTLKFYDIRGGNKIHLVLRLRGGGDGTEQSDDQVADDLNQNPEIRVAFKADGTMQDVTPRTERLPYTIIGQARLLLFNSWIHVLLVLIPVGFALNYTHGNSIAVFTVNFIAIIPSAMILSFAVNDISLRLGEILEGLLSTTFSNAVQIITSIFLLKGRQIAVLQTSLIGSILSNLLLMTGLGFLLGGVTRFEQHFNITIAQLLGSLLLLAATSLMVPTASHFLVNTSQKDILRQSHGTSVVMLFSYGLWLVFQLHTHSEFYEPSPKGEKRELDPGTTQKGLAKIGAAYAATRGSDHMRRQPAQDEEESEVPRLNAWVAIAVIIVSTVLIAFNTQFATDSINVLLKQGGVSNTFVGLVILPLLSNDPTTIINACKDKMDLSLASTIGKCMQTALMVIPLVVIIAWTMGVDDMTLYFQGFEVVALFASILIVNYIVQNGKSTWIEGALLVEAWIIVSIAAYFVP